MPPGGSPPKVSAIGASEIDYITSAKSVGTQTEDDQDEFFFSSKSSTSTCTDTNQFCSEFEDDENFLWFICPFCGAVFARQEYKLMEHKLKVHGICNKNRTAFILSQIDMSPKVMFKYPAAASPCRKAALVSGNIKLKLEFDHSVPPKDLSAYDDFKKDCCGEEHLSSQSHIESADVKSEADTEENYDIEMITANEAFDEFLQFDLKSPEVQSENTDTHVATRSQDINENMESESLHDYKRRRRRRRRRRKKDEEEKMGPSSPEPSNFEIEDPNICKFCHEKFDNSEDLIKDEIFHEKEESPYRCKICKAVFKDNVQRQNHHRDMHLPKPFACEVCGKAFTKKRVLEKHSKIHSSQKPYLCNHCGKSFSSKAGHSVHLQIHHGETNNEAPNSNSNGDKYECHICGRILKRKSSLEYHLNAHEDTEPLLCATCGKPFRLEAHLRNHIQRMHLGIRPERKYGCEVCGKMVESPALLKIHMVKHTTERLFECDICHKSFKDGSGLRTHKQSHNGERLRYKCTKCPRAFTHRKVLQSHDILKHSVGERDYKYECKFCGKKFFIESYCKGHEKRHDLSARKHICKYCGRQFLTPADCRKHERLHIEGGRISTKRALTTLTTLRNIFDTSKPAESTQSTAEES